MKGDDALETLDMRDMTEPSVILVIPPVCCNEIESLADLGGFEMLEGRWPCEARVCLVCDSVTSASVPSGPLGKASVSCPLSIVGAGEWVCRDAGRIASGRGVVFCAEIVCVCGPKPSAIAIAS